jgi:hypothetical protein
MQGGDLVSDEDTSGRAAFQVRLELEGLGKPSPSRPAQFTREPSVAALVREPVLVDFVIDAAWGDAEHARGL